MSNSQLSEKEFLEKLEQVVKENLGNEKFGASELAVNLQPNLDRLK